jgi:hypothetical protein
MSAAAPSRSATTSGIASTRPSRRPGCATSHGRSAAASNTRCASERPVGSHLGA